ncbi:fasciclin domain-containing protein [uncultured Pontibacter sp.]|uniref:fasciclin domain-containing protein n=1 Tax=uncultured Pontibacter sp. TaxID=453356 RepID=UPI00260683C5|nr:fasciclin domain-containing protein [uncultured Pontibacter sp.]
MLLVAFFLSAESARAQDETGSQRITLMQHVINERPVLAELLTTAGLAPALSGSTDYTLLAPPEASLQVLKGQSAEKIRSVLAMHIIKGKYKATDFKEGAKVPTYGGETLYVCRRKGSTLLNGVKLQAGDKEFRNGIVQEIEGFLQP